MVKEKARLVTLWLLFLFRLQLVPDGGYSHSDLRSSRKSAMRDWAKWKRQNELVFNSDGNPVKASDYDGEEDEEEDTMEGEAILVLGENDEVVEEEIKESKEECGGGDVHEGIEHDEDLVIDHVEEIVCTNDDDTSRRLRFDNTNDPKDENFNTFQFWREPLPNIDTELDSPGRSSQFQSSATYGNSSSNVANESYINNNPVDTVSLRPVRILCPPTVKNRSSMDKAQEYIEYLFRDPVKEEKPKPLVEPSRKYTIPNISCKP